MSQTKFNCTSCRRLIPISSTFCPFCSSEVKFTPPVPKKPATNSQTLSDLSSQKKQDKLEEVDFELNMEPISEESLIEKPRTQHNNATNQTMMQKKSAAEALFEEELPPSKSKPIPVKVPEKTVNDTEIRTNENSKLSQIQEQKIKWKDEKEKPLPKEDMYKNGVYNPNYDGMYNDTLPRIEHELDNLKSGKEKMIFRIIFGFIAIFGIIVYLVLTI